jgi:3-hydroxyisobutyrate dehydrogenase-like beta-hydroxyacid dehydrogenase
MRRQATPKTEIRAGSTPLGLVGLGNLGMPMALAAIEAGWAVTVFDKRDDRVAQCAAAGGQAASHPADLAGCGVVAIVVNDDAAVTEVLAGSGLLGALSHDAAVAVHSTILPATARKLGKLARQAGVRLVDAPVSGGADRARNGTLTLFAGGDAAAIDQLGGYFRTVASSIIRAGDVGAGSAAKLGNQLVMFAALGATQEAIRLGRAYGVDQEALLRAVAGGTGDCWAVRNWGFFDRTADDYDASGLPLHYRPWSKDLWDVVASARDHDLPVPLAGLLAQLMPGYVEDHAAAARSAHA